MTQTVHIGNGRIGLALALPAAGMPEIVAFGPWPVDAVAGPVAARSSRVNGMDADVTSAVLLPTGGMGFFGWPAIAGHRDGRDFVAQFQDWSVVEDGGATRLRASDPVARLSIAVDLSIFDAGVLSMTTTLHNDGDTPYCLDRCMAGSMLVPEGDADIVSFAGMWGREFRERHERLGRGLWLQESRRGRTSHDRFPGLFVAAGGMVAGIHVGWSGNHVLAVDTLDDGRRLVHGGELFEPGEVHLAVGERYVSPAVYLTAAATLDDAAARFRAFVSNDLIAWPGGQMQPRPVTLNTWEGNYFDHIPDALMAQASAAAALGVERFVLDDGWFGRRDDDSSSLGDWVVDTRKYPDGLRPLADHVTSLGMQFGIWFEPEMVNPDSDLYRAHPDWVLQVEGRPLLPSRRQFVLDLARREVSDHLFERMSAVLGDLPVAYVKWDMNRDLTHAGDRGGRAATSRQTRAVHALMDRLRAAHPHVEFESCASGGGRADYGVLARTHRLWTSDGTDALERLETQAGAMRFFPPEILGAHVSACPNHQTGRRHSLSFRAVVALAYHFGIELDPTRLASVESAELEGWIALHKRLRPLLHEPGAQFHLTAVDGRHAWGATAGDKIVLFVAQGAQMMREQPAPLRIPADGARAGWWRIAAMHPGKPEFVRMSSEQRDLLAGTRRFTLDTMRRGGLPLPALLPENGMVLELDHCGEECDG